MEIRPFTPDDAHEVEAFSRPHLRAVERESHRAHRLIAVDGDGSVVE